MRRLWFGKYEGEFIEDVPTDYLEWCLDNLKDMKLPLRAAFRAELKRRGALDEPAHNRICPRCEALARQRDSERAALAYQADDLRRTWDGWYRRLTLLLHPDRGGDTESMKLLNNANDELTELLRRLGQTASRRATE